MFQAGGVNRRANGDEFDTLFLLRQEIGPDSRQAAEVRKFPRGRENSRKITPGEGKWAEMMGFL